jgi:hypothetical protein
VHKRIQHWCGYLDLRFVSQFAAEKLLARRSNASIRKRGSEPDHRDGREGDTEGNHAHYGISLSYESAQVANNPQTSIRRGNMVMEHGENTVIVAMEVYYSITYGSRGKAG